jgi:hypothetical protein
MQRLGTHFRYVERAAVALNQRHVDLLLDRLAPLLPAGLGAKVRLVSLNRRAQAAERWRQSPAS